MNCFAFSQTGRRGFKSRHALLRAVNVPFSRCNMAHLAAGPLAGLGDRRLIDCQMHPDDQPDRQSYGTRVAVDLARLNIAQFRSCFRQGGTVFLLELTCIVLRIE